MTFAPRTYLYENTLANAAGGYNSGWPIGRGAARAGGNGASGIAFILEFAGV